VFGGSRVPDLGAEEAEKTTCCGTAGAPTNEAEKDHDSGHAEGDREPKAYAPHILRGDVRLGVAGMGAVHNAC
jgi:hypothetical protein